MTISEIHMIAEIFGSVFLAVTGVIIIFELHQNLKQRKIQNTFMRTIEVDKLFYKRMEKDTAILICKGAENYNDLEDYEKHQFNAYVTLTISMFNRADLMAEETTYLTGATSIKKTIRKNVKRIFENPGMNKSYSLLKEAGALDNYENFHKVAQELKLTPRN